MRLGVKPTAWVAAALALIVAWGMPGLANAGPSTLTISGSVEGSADGTPFAESAFTAVASFASSANLGIDGYSVYPAIFTFDISGVGTFTTVPSVNVLAIVITPPMTPGYGTYGVEIQAPGGAMSEFFDAANTSVVPPGDVQTVFSSPSTLLAGGFEQSSPLTLPLGGTDSLILNFDTLGSTATLDVPEPASLALLGFGMVVIAPLRRYRQR